MFVTRYPGDSYAGGNPWQLLTAVLGEVFYLGAEANLKNIEERGADYSLDLEANKKWIELLDTFKSKYKGRGIHNIEGTSYFDFQLIIFSWSYQDYFRFWEYFQRYFSITIILILGSFFHQGSSLSKLW